MRSKGYQRSMTSYLPSCEMNMIIQKTASISYSNSNEYRKFMQQNGERLMAQFAQDAYTQTLQENKMLFRTN